MSITVMLLAPSAAIWAMASESGVSGGTPTTASRVQSRTSFLKMEARSDVAGGLDSGGGIVDTVHNLPRITGDYNPIRPGSLDESP